MIFIKRLNKLKILRKLLEVFAIPVVFNVIIIILNIKEIISDDWIHVLGIDKESGIYYLLNEVVDFGKYKDVFLWCVIIICSVFIIGELIIFLRDNQQERLLIVEHNSLNQIKYRFSEEIQKEYNIKRLKFNQFETFNSNMPLNEMVIKAIVETDLKANEIRKYIAKDYSVGYAGIANIPTTFLLGFELGDENVKKYFHKYHGKKTDLQLKDDKFHLLKKKPLRGSFTKNILQEPRDNTKEGNIVIIISLTQPIMATDYTSIVGKNDYVIKYISSDDIDFDVIDSESQIDNYTDKIVADIAEIQKDQNIKQIRICVAASGSFVFGLGTKFSKTQNKETIVFHFEKNRYVWGINITNKKPVIMN